MRVGADKIGGHYELLSSSVAVNKRPAYMYAVNERTQV